MKFVIATILFTLSPFYGLLLGQSLPGKDAVTITGKVIDYENQLPLYGAHIVIKEQNTRTLTNRDGEFELILSKGTYTLQVFFIGYKTFTKQIIIDDSELKVLIIELEPGTVDLNEVLITDYAVAPKKLHTGAVPSAGTGNALEPIWYYYPPSRSTPLNSEQYSAISENVFKWAEKTPLSTFSIDVDAASYTNLRRMITNGYLPPADAIRIEELINYFDYNYSAPKNGAPFSVNTEISPAPWNPDHHLVQIGIQAERIKADNLPPSNLVFLIDVSGSMSSDDKLPLLKRGLKLLVNELREEDYVSLVAYADGSQVVLPPTSGSNKDTIIDALEQLRPGGSTAGSEGIIQAYAVAKKQYRKKSNNRVILTTDGDFNVGVSEDDELISLIEGKRDDGIFLSVLGFGTGNLKDSKMEQIANHGNGNYFYINNLLDAKKVLISEMGGTLVTIAKDVKIQVEFNPQNVQAYRLIGYENRVLADEDFNNDKIDAGELGSGHTVTALYEIIPAGVAVDKSLTDIDPLKYRVPTRPSLEFTNEIMTIKLRYKPPYTSASRLMSTVVEKDQFRDKLSKNMSFAASVASFGMLLRDSRFKGNSSFEMVNELARNGKGSDNEGYRAEFIRIAELAGFLWQGNSKKD